MIKSLVARRTCVIIDLWYGGKSSMFRLRMASCGVIVIEQPIGKFWVMEPRFHICHLWEIVIDRYPVLKERGEQIVFNKYPVPTCSRHGGSVIRKPLSHLFPFCWMRLLCMFMYSIYFMLNYYNYIHCIYSAHQFYLLSSKYDDTQTGVLIKYFTVEVFKESLLGILEERKRAVRCICSFSACLLHLP